MANLINRPILILCFIGFMCNAFNASAISINTKRLYLSPQSDVAMIYIVSKETETQRCQISIKDPEIISNSIIQLLPEGQVAVNSAAEVIRFSPRRFDIVPTQYQNVKFSYRRRPGVEIGEYKGLVSIRCKTITDNNADDNKQMVTVTPQIVLNVPIIVHTEDLTVSANFESVKLTGKQVEVNIKIEGERAITGDLELIDKNTGEVLASKKEMSIYWESPTKQVILPINKSINSPLIIRFKESPEFGGNLMIEQVLQSL
jgi:hypothetical protein